MHSIRRRRIALSLVAVLATIFAMAQPASAHTGTSDPFGGGSLFTDIKAGDKGEDIGDAWFNRSDDGDGTETLRIHFHVAEGVSQWQLCYGDTAYTERIAPGRCQLQSGNLSSNPTTGDIAVDLGSAFVGKTLYAQFHVVTGDGETTYAGWQPGDPFYGNVVLGDRSASIANADCTNDGAVVSLSNSGGDSVTFTIAKDGTTVTTVAVAGGGSTTYTVALAEDETATVSVSAPGMTTVSKSVTLDCDQNGNPANPSASIADASCTENGAVVSLSNTGGEAVTFTISKAGATLTTVEVAAGGTASYTVPLAEDETATVSVSAPGMTTVTKSVTKNCVLNEVITRTSTDPLTPTTPTTPQVAGVQAVRAAGLAATGMPSVTLRLMELALALLLAGSVMVRRGRRQHR